MKWMVAVLICWGACLGAWSQEERFEEVRETLRFLRLAETRKQLPFDEDTLLKLNELLDDYEKELVQARRGESGVMAQLRRAKNKNLDDQEAAALLERVVAMKKAKLERDLDLLERVGSLLTPSETIIFYDFYERHQRNVQKRVRALMQERRRMRR